MKIFILDSTFVGSVDEMCLETIYVAAVQLRDGISADTIRFQQFSKQTKN